MKYWIRMLVLLFSVQSYAGYNNYDLVWPTWLDQYFKGVNQSIQALPNFNLDTGENETSCKTVSKIFQKDRIEIRYALGYFDESFMNQPGSPRQHLSPSLDIISFNMIREFLKKPCADAHQKLCDFVESGDASEGRVELSKKMQYGSQNKDVVVILTQASASEVYLDNKSILKDRQKKLSLQSEENFFGGIQSADVVMYNGHSRDGGGPDFHPPVLNQSLHTDYAYYKAKKKGLTHLLSSLAPRKDNNLVLGLFSCYSKSHFQASINKVKPGVRTILSTDKIDYMNTTFVSLGYLEALLNKTCGAELEKVAKQNDRVKWGFGSYNIK